MGKRRQEKEEGDKGTESKGEGGGGKVGEVRKRSFTK